MTELLTARVNRVRTSIGRGTLLFFAVIFPLGVIALEALTGFCAGVFFDPIPTVWHILLALTVPLANLLALNAPAAPSARYWKMLGMLNAFAIVVAGYFSAMYAMLTPLALIAVLFLGLGILPLSPAFSLIATIVVRLRLAASAGAKPRFGATGLVSGLLAGLLCVGMVQAPRSMTHIMMQVVGLGDGEHPVALSILRSLGNREVMLAACYQQNTENMDPFSWAFRPTALSTEEARGLYYRVTGDPYQAVPLPRTRRMFGDDRLDDRWQWDERQGSERVGPQLAGLSMRQSRMDAVADSAANLAYLQWTMAFRNDSWQDSEARARISLPPGAVVSRATLWINGEEREAAFGGRDQTRRAYQEVAIRQRRDPLLVTTAGPDRVQIQCFPIQRNGGEMKIRLGITVPLEALSASESRLWLPAIAEQNFSIPGAVLHSIWLAGDSKFSSNTVGLTPEPDGAGFALRGELGNPELWNAAISLMRDPARNVCWTDEPAAALSRTIVQELRVGGGEPPKSLVVVVDLSRRMAPQLQRVMELLAALPDGTRVGVFGASDDVIDASGGIRPLDSSLRSGIANSLRKHASRGGTDSVPALERAWDMASAEGSNVLWMHGVQPYVYKPTDSLLQRMERRPGTQIIAAQLSPGPNKALEEIEAHVVACRAQTGAEIALRLSSSGMQRVLRELAPGEAIPVNAVKSSAHLTRLWANERVATLVRAGKASATREAVELATTAQLVTPLTGAVVLETKAQYDRHQLQPADAESVPTVPEPASLAIAGVMMLLLGRRPRRLAA